MITIADILRGRRQHMWIMNVVWPVTMLYAGPIGLWLYFKTRNNQDKRPLWQSICLATTHCGSGCTLGDICAEVILFVLPFTIFGSALAASWTLDYLLAFVIGIAFQYFTIKPMKELSWRQGIIAALKADTLSLTAWQVGMYGWMAIAMFLIFPHHLPKTGWLFWFMMQVAMLLGFATAFPVNYWLVKKGIKEAM